MNYEPFDDPHPNLKTLENKEGEIEGGIDSNVWLFSFFFFFFPFGLKHHCRFSKCSQLVTAGH